MAKVVEFGWKNINSYGNKLNTIELNKEPGLILISGKNGGGKTTIHNALVLAEYGKTAKRNLKDLPNRINKALHVYVIFETNDGKLIEIHRGLQPSFLDVKVDGVPFEMKDKTKLNQIIEQNYLGIPFDVASNTTLLSINDFKSFVKMKKEDKRKIINKIFPIEDLDKMYEILKGDVKVVKESIGQLLHTITTNQNILENYNVELSRMEDEAKQHDEKRLNELISEIANLSDQVDSLSKKGIGINDKIKTINTELEIAKEQADVKYQQAKNNNYSKIKELELELSEYTNSIEKQIKPKYEQQKLEIKEGYDIANKELEQKRDVSLKKLNEFFDSKIKEQTDIFISKKQEAEKSVLVKKEDLNSKLSKLSDFSKKIDSNISDTQNQLNETNTSILTCNKTIKAYKEGKCYECGTEFHDEKHLKELDSFNNMLKNLTNLQEEISNKLLDMNKKKEGISLKYKEINDLLFNLNNEHNKLINTINNDHQTELANYEIDRQSKSSQLNNITTQNINENNTKSFNEINLIQEKYNTELESNISNKRNVIKSQIDQLNSDLETKHREIYDVYSQYQKYSNENISKLNIEIAELRERVGILKTKKESLINEKESLEKTSSKAELIDLKKKQVNEQRLNLDSLEMEKLILENKLANYERTRELFLDDGLKKVILGKFLPMFNSKIEALVQFLDYKFSFSFDDEFNPIITHMGEEISAETMSSGEEKMMDIIVILAMLELIKMKNPDLNIMFLDEIYNTLDLENIKKVTSILHRYTTDYNLNIFIISHTPVPMEYFDKQFLIEKEGQFSEIKTI